MATRKKGPAVPRKSKAKSGALTGGSKNAAEVRYALFVEAYMANGQNGKRAAIEAGYSENGAEVTASKLLRHHKVKLLLDRRQAEVRAAAEAKTGVTVEGVLLELRDMIHSDLRAAFDERGVMLPPHLWPDALARAVCSVKVVEKEGGLRVSKKDKDGNVVIKHVPMYTKEVKLYDKGASIERAMKHLGMFKQDNAQRGDAAIRALMAAVGEQSASFSVKP